MIAVSSRWLGTMSSLILLGFCTAARAQTLSVSLSSDGTQSLTAGSSFSNGGTITVTASAVPSGATVTIDSITLSVGNAGLFDSLTLSGSAPRGSSDFSVPLTSGSNTATFSSIELSNGQSATFVLNGMATSNPPAGSNFAMRRLRHFEQASMLPAAPAMGLSLVYLGFAALGLLAMSGRLRRRHLAIFAVWLLMAAGVMSCGQGGSASSDQQITAVSATSSSGNTVSVSGVPVDLGAISVEVDTTTTIPEPTPT
ncbi:MAG: hypothetical protein ACLQU2_02825 [Candidatus Binataceae bacterium]